MKRLKFIIILFFISSKVFSYNFTYLETKIPSESIEMYIYNYIKFVIANSEPKIYLNTITFIWNSSEVIIYEYAWSKGRYPDPDTIIVLSDKRFKKQAVIIFNEKRKFYDFSITPLPSRRGMPDTEKGD